MTATCHHSGFCQSIFQGDRVKEDSALQLSESLLYALWQAQTTAQRAVEQLLKPLGLTATQYGTLDALAGEGPLSAAAVAKLHGVRAQSVAGAVHGLEQRGLVRRRPHPDHGRITLIEITPDGRRVHRKADASYRELESTALGGLPPAQQTQLRNGLRHVFERIRA
jgi:DNA-binding MarR family transcriptional regulator